MSVVIEHLQRTRGVGVAIVIMPPLVTAALSRKADIASNRRSTATKKGALQDALFKCRTRADQPFFKHSRPSSSAICTAFKAAPLRRLSDTHHRFSPLSIVLS